MARNPNRAFNDEADSAIFRPIKEPETFEAATGDDMAETIVYTIVGKNDTFDESGNPVLHCLVYPDSTPIMAKDRDLACAMKVGGAMFIRQLNSGHFVDPTSDAEQAQHNKTRLGISELRWTDVPVKPFLSYLAFLRTKNRAHLVNAEREAF